tara:strand:+ start:62 stop:538 length:477 start_codon:yes stop_codon:yes gene_type:complete
MKYWLIATYKTNETNRLEKNLSNQNFDYYLPKIVIKKNNSILGEEVLFPGYIFINTTLDKYTLLKYTKGIKKVLKFGKTIPSLTDNEIKTIQSVVKLTKTKPISKKIKLGQEAIIAEGPFKGTLVKICSLPSKNRIEVLLTILGSQRRVSFLKKDLIF